MLIDLGDDWSPLEEDAPEGPHWTGWRSVLLAVTLLPVLLTGAAAPRPVPEVIVLSDVELPAAQESIEFPGDAVVVRTRRALTVYELDGRVRWTTSALRFSDAWLRADDEHGLLLVQNSGFEQVRTVALDLHDGHEVWAYDGFAEILTDIIAVHGTEQGRLAVFDLVTRAQRWQQEGHAFIIDAKAGAVFVLARDGTLSERQLRSGTVTRSVKLDLPAAEHYHLDFQDGDLAILYNKSLNDEVSKLILLDRETLKVRPEIRTYDHPPTTNPRLPCGPVTCEIEFRTGSVSVFDPQSGKRLWDGPPDRVLQHTLSGLVSYPWSEGGASAMIQLHEPRTGQVIQTITGWLPIRATNEQFGMAPVVLRRVIGKTDRTYLAGFTTQGFRVFGSVPRNLFQCQYKDWRLACLGSERRMVVLQINSRTLVT